MDIKAVVRRYVAEHHLESGKEGDITDATPLVAYGILDSLAVMQLVTFLEAEFGIEFTPHDFDRRSLESIGRIEQLVRKKLAGRETGGAKTGLVGHESDGAGG